MALHVYIVEGLPSEVTFDSPNGHSDVDSMTNDDINIETERSSPLPSAKQKQRKRELDKMAASKYRSRKKQKTLALDKQQAELEQENTELTQQVKSAEQEIVMLKSLLREIYAPCNHSNHTVPETAVEMVNSSMMDSNNETGSTQSVNEALKQSMISRMKTSADVPIHHHSQSNQNVTIVTKSSSINSTSSDKPPEMNNNLFAVIWNKVTL